MYTMFFVVFKQQSNKPQSIAAFEKIHQTTRGSMNRKGQMHRGSWVGKQRT